jgi:hypothetical protein
MRNLINHIGSPYMKNFFFAGNMDRDRATSKPRGISGLTNDLCKLNTYADKEKIEHGTYREIAKMLIAYWISSAFEDRVDAILRNQIDKRVALNIFDKIDKAINKEYIHDWK